MLRQSQVNKIKQAHEEVGRALREFAVGHGPGRVTMAWAVLRAALRNATSEEIALAKQRSNSAAS
jgi:4-hydroxyphenylpyruvate dioxygenase-like putative hemolysin